MSGKDMEARRLSNAKSKAKKEMDKALTEDDRLKCRHKYDKLAQEQSNYDAAKQTRLSSIKQQRRAANIEAIAEVMMTAPVLTTPPPPIAAETESVTATQSRTATQRKEESLEVRKADGSSTKRTFATELSMTDAQSLTHQHGVALTQAADQYLSEFADKLHPPSNPTTFQSVLWEFKSGMVLPENPVFHTGHQSMTEFISDSFEKHSAIRAAIPNPLHGVTVEMLKTDYARLAGLATEYMTEVNRQTGTCVYFAPNQVQPVSELSEKTLNAFPVRLGMEGFPKENDFEQDKFVSPESLSIHVILSMIQQGGPLVEMQDWAISSCVINGKGNTSTLKRGTMDMDKESLKFFNYLNGSAPGDAFRGDLKEWKWTMTTVTIENPFKPGSFLKPVLDIPANYVEAIAAFCRFSQVGQEKLRRSITRLASESLTTSQYEGYQLTSDGRKVPSRLMSHPVFASANRIGNMKDEAEERERAKRARVAYAAAVPLSYPGYVGGYTPNPSDPGDRFMRLQ